MQQAPDSPPPPSARRRILPWLATLLLLLPTAAGAYSFLLQQQASEEAAVQLERIRAEETRRAHEQELYLTQQEAALTQCREDAQRCRKDIQEAENARTNVEGQLRQQQEVLSTLHKTLKEKEQQETQQREREKGRHPGDPIGEPIYEMVPDFQLMPDGRHALLAHLEHLELWDIETRQCIRKAKASDLICFLRYHAEAKLVVTITYEGHIELWDSETFELKKSTKHNSRILVAAIHRDGKSVVTGDSDYKLCRWNAETGELMDTKQPTRDNERIYFLSMSYSSRGTWMAMTGIGNPTFILFNTTGRKNAYSNLGKKQRVQGTTLNSGTAIAHASFSKDESFAVLSVFDEPYIQIWDTRNHGFKSSPIILPTPARCALITPDNATVIAGGENGMVTFWDVATRQRKELTLQFENDIQAMQLSEDGSTLAVSVGSTLQFWRIK